MKKILITGLKSYIGNSIENWIKKNSDMYSIEKISLRDGFWRKENFSAYDVIVHVAGIAHVSSDPKMKELYYKVNRDLTIEIAKKAKAEGVKQFIFLSSIIVYGEGSCNKRVIGRNTIPVPSNFYGDSKLQAEEGLKLLEGDNFKIAVLRPPMIYGNGSKGNYSRLSKVAKLFPVFPDINNERSMLHIDNLCEIIKLIIDYEESGVFFPQNKEYVKTSEMVKLIAESRGKKIILTEIFNPLIKIMMSRVKVLNKVFGNLVYDKHMSEYKVNYRINDLKKSIELTEKIV